MVTMRGIRGATTVSQDEKGMIAEATRELLGRMMEENDLDEEALISVIFTSTPDLHAGFPAAAAREMGLIQTPLLSAQEVDVSGALPRCVRVLMLVETPRRKTEIRHVYLHEAVQLRPDWAGKDEQK